MAGSMIIDKEGTRRPVPLHGPEAFAAMRRAGRLAAETLDFVTPHVRHGVSTGELDRLIDGLHARARRACRRRWAIAAIPRAAASRSTTSSTTASRATTSGCATATSPTSTSPCVLDGWYGDTSRMFVVGDRAPVKALKLVEVTFEAMWAGIRAVRPGRHAGRCRPRHPDRRRGQPVLGGARLRRPRARPRVPRLARGQALRQPGRGAGAAAGHAVHDRADDQCRPAPR